jgi:hypothetical protein
MEKFTRIFTAVSRKQSGMSIVEVGVASFITLASSVVAYNQIRDNRDAESSPSFREMSSNVHSHVNAVLNKLLKPVDGQITNCVTNGEINELASGKYNTSTGSIHPYREGAFSENVDKMGKAYCKGTGMKCFVRKQYLNTKNENGEPVKRLEAETLFGAEAVSVTIERKVVSSCLNSELAKNNMAPGLRWFMQTTDGNSMAMSKKLEDVLVGDLPKNAEIMTTIYTPGGGGETGGVKSRHYWLDWYYRYVNFDKIPEIGQGLLYGYKTDTVRALVRNGRSASYQDIVYARMWYTYGCSLQQIQASDPKCRCFVAIDNASYASSQGYTKPDLCVTTNQYGNEYNPWTFLAAYRH